ncbi:GGDEF domain-containing protein [Oceanospirillum maris]|uniref:GGDEF domain-containing protein n=1 Tax=Oceanospirillum maris TaxID=64977 RepID=UPI00048357B4|nr:GGDEF domain-containing protein [Oceanospirillum maris]
MSRRLSFQSILFKCFTAFLLYLLSATTPFKEAIALAETLALSGTGAEATPEGTMPVYQAYLHWMLFVTVLIVVVVYWNHRLSSEIKARESTHYLAQSYLNIINRYVITSRTGLDGTITDVSQAFCDISGYNSSELVGNSHSIIRHPHTEEGTYRQLWEKLNKNQSWTGEMCNRRKDGTAYWVHASITPDYDESGKKTGYIAVHQDITDHRIVRELSLRDPLTSLYNRRYFNEIFDQQLQDSQNPDVSLIILDIDNFKKYNDTYGHQKGDTALKQIANCLEDACHNLNAIHASSSSESKAYAFRIGGEEFTVITRQNEQEALTFAQRLCDSILELQIEHVNNDNYGVMTISIGCYSYHADGLMPAEADEIFRIADQALYRAKELGRNQVQSTNSQETDIELF